MKSFLYLVFLIPLFRFEACVKENALCNKGIVVENASDTPIYVSPSAGGWTDNYLGSEDAQLIGSGASAMLKAPKKQCWEHVFHDRYDIDSDTLFLEVLNDKDELLHRYKLTLSDLRKQNFKFTHREDHE